MAISVVQSLAATEARTPQNILFMMADQMRADALSCAGNPAIKTPNLDRLAAEGVRFSNAFSSTPSCTPARAAILTGLSPWYHGMLGYGTIAPRYSHFSRRFRSYLSSGIPTSCPEPSPPAATSPVLSARTTLGGTPPTTKESPTDTTKRTSTTGWGKNWMTMTSGLQRQTPE